MLVKQATQADIIQAAVDAGVRVENLRGAGLGIRKPVSGYRFTLGLMGARIYQRRSYQGRHVAAVCYHGHLAFYRALYTYAPEAVVQTAMVTYRSADDLEACKHVAACRNIGSRMEPLHYNEACDCHSRPDSFKGRIERGT